MPLLLDWLIANFPNAKRQTLRDMLSSGRVSINGEPARSLKQPITAEDDVKILPRPQKAKASIDPLRIIHEDADILVIEKPAGLLTSTVSREPRPTAIGIIRAYLADREPAARPGIIHRLDRDASGLLVFSKNNEAYESLKRQFFKHTVDRIYIAVVQGKPQRPKDRIESTLMELPDGRVVSTRDPAKGQPATTDYELIKTVTHGGASPAAPLSPRPGTPARGQGEGSADGPAAHRLCRDAAGDISILRVTLQTGRKHQIRAHLSQCRLPIIGDKIYGPEKHPHSPLLLCATTLAFAHPRTGQRMTFEIAPPAPIQAFLDRA